MRSIASSVLASMMVAGLGGCLEDTAPEQSPFDSGVGSNVPCPTCLIEAGLITSVGDAAVPETLQCNQLDPGVCANYLACAPITGLAYDAARYCRAENPLPVACQARVTECGFGQIRVIDPAGQRWLLPNRCIPPGYNPAPEEIHPISWIEDYTVCPSAGLQTRCGQLDERACAANESCFAQRGTQLNERRSCKEGGQRFVACVQNTTCNRVLTIARDPTGVTWELIGSCLPSGFTALPTSSVASRLNWPSCGF